MVIIRNRNIAHIPVLDVVKAELEDQGAPAVFFLHGYTSAKEHNLHVAYLLAEKGFRVLLPDALHHGEREGRLFGRERDLAFWEIVLTSIKELEQMKDALVAEGSVDANRLGVIGTSMGAITMYGALAAYPWIQTAVSFMGTAYYETYAKAQIAMLEQDGELLDTELKQRVLSQIRPFDLSQQLDKLAGRPLFIWHGTEDQVIPFPFSEKLHETIAASYQDKPDHLHFSAEANTPHKVTRTAVLKSVSWCEEHLLGRKVSS
ncbi:alpha/beta fold hydrolase [Halalkalibacter oceani]|uniref:alpha/beta fold hydrolase n=1 Tax=Halalkalibacter oceani TaxID=1653776 RepID=UPI003399103D